MDAGHLLDDLDDQQRAAVVTPSTLVAVIASAGSGKTRVLARRMAYRIATETADARHTLALTFTREAAGELRRRLRSLGMRETVEAGTFHSVALGLLRQRWTDTGRLAPNVIADRERLLAEVANDVPLAVLATERSWIASRGIRPADYATVAKQINRRCGVPGSRIGGALEAYDVLKRRRGVIDLDDLLLILSNDLATDAAFADAMRWRFRHVLVDEAQDVNPVQHRLLHQLTSERRDLFLVGDPAQAIYAFNGSDPTLLTDVDRHLPGIEVVRLTTNRRCTPQIVAAAHEVLRASGQSSDAVSARGDGVPLTTVVGADETDEAAKVAALVRGLPYGRAHGAGVAVLARTNEQLVGLRAAMTRAGVPMRRVALAPGSTLAASVRAATMMTSASELRAWAHDILEVPPDRSPYPSDERPQADRRVAAAILDFLREQPVGDGFALRAWIAANNPFNTPADADGVELLTFHAAKGREWHTVVVSGVETGLVPHRSAMTVDARAEEARLLHVAITRASDELIVTRAERRRGYARQISPLAVGLTTGPDPVVAAPADIKAPADPVRRRADTLVAWRRSAARASAMLAEQICSDDDLLAIAATPPSTPDELSAITGFGPIAATRLFQPIRAALDAASSAPDLD